MFSNYRQWGIFDHIYLMFLSIVFECNFSLSFAMLNLDLRNDVSEVKGSNKTP